MIERPSGRFFVLILSLLKGKTCYKEILAGLIIPQHLVIHSFILLFDPYTKPYLPILCQREQERGML